MQDRLISVGEDLTLPSSVKVGENSLPDYLSRESISGDNTVPPVTEDLSNTYLSIREAPITPLRFGAKADGKTDDTDAINAAIAALPAGGHLYFPPGRYITRGGHVVTSPSVTIEGSSGRAQTYNSQGQLFLANGSNSDMLTVQANQVTVRNLSLYGNYSKQTGKSRGLVTPETHGANYLLLDSVWVDSFNGDGYYLSSLATLSATISNSESRQNRGYGMNFTGTATDTMVTGCYVDQNALSGIMCTAADISLTSVHVWGNGTAGDSSLGSLDGITFQSSAGCRVINCYIETQHNGAGIRFSKGTNRGHIISDSDIWSNGFQGIYAYDLSNSVISSNVIRQNNYKGQVGGAGAGILVDNCRANSITGNSMFSSGVNRQTYGYYESGTLNSGNIFMGNTSRAADHVSGNWVIAPESATKPENHDQFNAG